MAKSLTLLLLITLLSLITLCNASSGDTSFVSPEEDSLSYGHNSTRGLSGGVDVRDEIPSRELILVMAKLSQIVYIVDDCCNYPKVTKTGAVQHYFLDAEYLMTPPLAGGTQLMIVTYGGYVVVVVRGTELTSVNDLESDFEFSFTDFTGVITTEIRVHSGFHREAFGQYNVPLYPGESVYSNVEKKVMEILADNTLNLNGEVIFTGHSLGGAVAHLLAAAFSTKHHNIISRLYTFGEPRVGNAKFKSWFNGATNLSVWRFVNKDDIIARIPYNWIGYHHQGHLVECLDKAKLIARWRHTGGLKDQKFNVGACEDWYDKNSFGDHKMKNYLKCLNKAKKWIPRFQRSKEVDAITKLYFSTNGDNWKDIPTNWFDNSDSCNACHWKQSHPHLDYKRQTLGIICNENDEITHVKLERNKLSGTIPQELKRLTSLKALRLQWNDLSGTVPTQLGKLQNLEYLMLQRNNNINGAIPEELGTLIKLTTLDLGNNKLTGPIPSSIGNLVNLNSLYLDDNALTGEVPAELAIRKMSVMYLYGNSGLTGSMPDAICNLPPEDPEYPRIICVDGPSGETNIDCDYVCCLCPGGWDDSELGFWFDDDR